MSVCVARGRGLVITVGREARAVQGRELEASQMETARPTERPAIV